MQWKRARVLVEDVVLHIGCDLFGGARHLLLLCRGVSWLDESEEAHFIRNLVVAGRSAVVVCCELRVSRECSNMSRASDEWLAPERSNMVFSLIHTVQLLRYACHIQSMMLF